jgi:hypothetical protein
LGAFAGNEGERSPVDLDDRVVGGASGEFVKVDGRDDTAYRLSGSLGDGCSRLLVEVEPLVEGDIGSRHSAEYAGTGRQPRHRVLDHSEL